MSTTRNTPPLLQPYLTLLPETSLLLLTSVLGASTNWLVLQYLNSLIHGGVARSVDGGDGEEAETKVVLVSFLRDWGFWRDGSRKLGLDLDKLASKGRIGYIDGLTGLFTGIPQQKNRDESSWKAVLRSPDLESVKREILGMVTRLQAGGSEGQGKSRIVLVVDGLDFLLAAVGDVNAVRLGDMVMELRENAYATILALSADDPLVKAQHTTLETDAAAFFISVAHQADLALSLRLLDTGTAKDVSGVLRVKVDNKSADGDEETRLEGKELLYFVGGDGSVKVFERGQ